MQAKVSAALAVGVIAAAATAAVVAHADGSRAGAAATTGGLGLTTTTISRPAAAGASNVVNVVNHSKQSLTITVAARPWIQSSTGQAVPNRKSTLGDIGLSTSSFTLAPGKDQDVTVSLTSVPTVGYQYGALEIIGMPKVAAKGITTAYRLVGTLRYTPATSVYGLKIGAAKVIKVAGDKRQLALKVTNSGNTVAPVTGTIRIKGPLGTRQASVPSTRVLPGKSVTIGLVSSFPAGTYTAKVNLKQGTFLSAVTKTVKVTR